MQEFNLDFARVIEDSCRCAKYKGRGGILFTPVLCIYEEVIPLQVLFFRPFSSTLCHY